MHGFTLEGLLAHGSLSLLLVSSASWPPAWEFRSLRTPSCWLRERSPVGRNELETLVRRQ